MHLATRLIGGGMGIGMGIMIINRQELDSQVDELMQKCSSFNDLLKSLISNCGERAEYLMDQQYQEHINAGKDWKRIAGILDRARQEINKS